MTHHISHQKEVALRKWVNEVRNDRVTYPHGIPFEHELQLIEEMLDHKDDEPERLHTSSSSKSVRSVR